MVVLPSFVQTADAQTALDPIDVFGDPIDDPWGDWGGWGDDDWGCQSLGCESSDDGGGSSSNPPPPPPPSPFQTCTTGINSVINANGHYQAARALAIAMGGAIGGLQFVLRYPVGSTYTIVYLDGSRGAFLVSCPACGTANLSTNLGCTP